MITKPFFDQIVSLLLPEMDDAKERRELIRSALQGSPVLQRIDWDGTARTFTPRLVRLLDDYGSLDNGQSALAALLVEIKQQAKKDRQELQAQIDVLLAHLYPTASSPSITVSPTLPIEMPTPRPPEPRLPDSEKIAVVEPLRDRAVETKAGPPAAPQATTSISPARTLHPSVNTSRWPRYQPFEPKILLMKGGGVKGIAFVGALDVLEAHGYRFNHFVGTSAGAISAALLAVGYSASELGTVLAKTNFREFKDGWLPLALLLLPLRKGLYRGEAFRRWLEEKLRAKFPQYDDTIPIAFKHLKEVGNPPPRLTIFASTRDKTAVPFDSNDQGQAKRDISFACRCSMAIPYFFEPEKLDGKRVFDGGMQNNYPVDALLKYFPDLKDSANFMGLYLCEKGVHRSSKWVLLDLFSIWGEAGDEEAKEEFIDRTIVIDPRPIKTTNFSLSPNDVKFLLAEGRASALHWLNYRSDQPGALQQEYDEAKQKSEALRTLVITERWHKFWPKLVVAIVLFLALIGWGISSIAW